MLGYLRLVRLPNLLIVALVQYIIFYQLLKRPLEAAGIELALSGTLFEVFVLTTVLLTAGGYIINDLMDIKTDAVNRPDEQVLYKRVAVENAKWLYFFCNLLGFALALFLAFVVQPLWLINIYPAAVGGLYVYSRYLKRTPLAGNIWISLYCAGASAILWFAEREAWGQLTLADPAEAAKMALAFQGYIGFSFLVTLYREMIKDLEDESGDRAAGMNTLPVAIGVAQSKRITIATGIGLWCLLAALVVFVALVMPLLPLLLSLAGILLPASVSLYLLVGATEPKTYHKAGQWVKALILGGVLLLAFI